MRGRIAERFELDPARVAVGNGSCEILLAAAEALCEPGDELLFAWPSFSIYPHLAALSGAREIRVPLADGYVHDLDAMLAEVTAATQLICVCNPNNPTGTHLPAEAVEGVLRTAAGPRHDRPRRGLRRVPDRRRPGRHRRPAGRVPEPDGRCGRSARLTAWRAFGAATRSARPGFRAALDAVRQPFSVNELAQVAAAEAVMHADDVAERVERTIVERVFVEEGIRELGLDPPPSQANFSWVPLGERDERAVINALGERGVVVRGGEGLGDPGHIRVTYGTRAENERFLAALGEALGALKPPRAAQPAAQRFAPTACACYKIWR